MDDFISNRSNLSVAEKWTKKNCQLFKNISNKIILRDSSNIQWVKLFSYDKIENKDDNYEGSYFYTGKQDIWLKSEGYFVDKKQFANIKNAITNQKITDERLFGGFNITSLFLRKYVFIYIFCQVFIIILINRCSFNASAKHDSI